MGTIKKTILFVDDNPDVLNVGNLILKSLKHKILLANSGRKAIEILNDPKSKIDLIFLDIMMPEINGFDVLEFIKNSNIQIPVVVQTGMLEKSDLDRAEKLGAIDWINKPYVKSTIKYLIDKHTNYEAGSC